MSVISGSVAKTSRPEAGRGGDEEAATPK